MSLTSGSDRFSGSTFEKSIKELVNSSAILLSSQFFSFLLTIVKNKVFALYLGPYGMGILAAFNSTIDIIVQTFGLGTSSAIVRETASNIDDENKLSQTIDTIKTISFIQAIIACIFTLVFSEWLSAITFTNYNYSAEFRILSAAVFFSMLYRMNISIIEGLVVIKRYAYQILLSTFFVVLTSSFLVIAFGNQAIIPTVLITILLNFIISELVQRKSLVSKAFVGFRLSIQYFNSLVSVSLTMFLGGLISAITIYFSRIFIVKVFGLESLGYVQAAQSLAFIYINFVLGGITKYYFPKLVSHQNDNSESGALLNAQLQVGILTSIPISFVLSVLAPFILRLVYTADFQASISVFRWFLLVGYLKISSWPLSYLLVAKNNWKIYLVTELFSNSMFIATLLLTWEGWGIGSVGFATTAQYILYLTMLIVYLNRNESGLLSQRSLIYLVIYGSLITFTTIMLSLPISPLYYILTLIVSFLTCIYSAYSLFLIYFKNN